MGTNANKKKQFAFYIGERRVGIAGSDMVPVNGLAKGNAVLLLLACNSEKEIKQMYRKLSAGGTANHPLENTFWALCLAGLRISMAACGYCIITKRSFLKLFYL